MTMRWRSCVGPVKNLRIAGRERDRACHRRMGTWAPQERGRSLADTYNLGGWFTAAAAVGPARARCRTCARKGPVSGRGGPGHWRQLAATAAWLGDVPQSRARRQRDTQIGTIGVHADLNVARRGIID